MRTINVQGWTEIEEEGEQDPKSQLSSRPSETSRIAVTFSEVTSSIDETQMGSDYIPGTGDSGASVERVLGEAASAVDRALELAFYIISHGEVVNICINIRGKFVGENVPDVSLTCTVEMNVLELGKMVYDYCLEEAVLLAQRYQTLGVELYKCGSYHKQVSAAFLFSRAIKWLILTGPKESEDDNKTSNGAVDLTEYNTVKCQCYNNIALFYIQQGNSELALQAASSVLNTEPGNVKALYRRAVANIKLQNYEVALQDLGKALTIDPENSQVKRQIAVVNNRQKHLDNQYAQAMKKFING
ncbi:unnamed protein product [Meganyctiphanes norvegica]|uniref:peptidylprolyl isomerase n=1 Tax=Meganyctiphanes norvegica TaxID=48144 RepID=A0AAV2QVP3_MEGNR